MQIVARLQPTRVDQPNLVRFSRLCMVATLAIFTYELVHQLRHQKHGAHLGDFPTFYIAAQFALHHRDIYSAQTSPAMIYVYPPLIAFLFGPLTILPLWRAGQVWLLMNLLMLLGSILVGVRAVQRRLNAIRPATFWPAVLLVSILASNQIHCVLDMGETDGLMLLMFTLGLYWLDRRPAWAGAALALALNVKYLSLVMLPYLLLRRRWNAVAGFAVATLFFALIPSVSLGWHEDLRCLRVATGGLLRWFGVQMQDSNAIKVHDIADQLSISATSLLARVMSQHGSSHLAIMAAATGTGIAALMIIVRCYHANRLAFWFWPPRGRQLGQPFDALVALDWAGLTAAALTFSPDTNTRHLVMAVLVLAVAAVVLTTPRPGVSRSPALAGAVIIFLSFIMPFGRSIAALRLFYYTYSIPGVGLLVGYLLILQSGLRYAADLTSDAGGSSEDNSRNRGHRV